MTERTQDVKDTALLTFNHIKGNDDQWIYLPALKRVKRIASANKLSAFSSIFITSFLFCRHL